MPKERAENIVTVIARIVGARKEVPANFKCTAIEKSAAPPGENAYGMGEQIGGTTHGN